MDANIAKNCKKEECDILYHIMKKGFMAEVHRFSFGYLLSEFKEKFDKADLERILDNLVMRGDLIKINEDYGIPNPKKFQEIRQCFWKRNAIDWSRNALLQTWQFLWKHVIITIAVSVIVAYITAKLIMG